MRKPAREQHTPFRGTFSLVNDAYLALQEKHPHLARAAAEEYEAIQNKGKTKLYPGHGERRTIKQIKQEIGLLESEMRDLEEELDDLREELAAISSDPPEVML